MAAQRGKNFTGPELKQLCLSFLEISQDPCVGSGQKKDSFWERVGEHYEKNKPRGAEQRTSKSLESKWGEIRHDTSRFIGCFQQVENLDISGTNGEDTLEKARELYKVRHPKAQSFTFPECFEVLKDCPRWAMPIDAMAKGKGRSKQTSVRKELSNAPCSGDDTGNQPPVSPQQAIDPDQGSADGGNSTSFDGKRPAGSKNSKESAKKAKLQEDSFKISAQAQKVMVETGRARLRILENQQVMSMFSMPLQNLEPEEREFMRMWRLEEMRKLKDRMGKQSSTVVDASPPAVRSPLPTPQFPEENLQEAVPEGWVGEYD